MIQLSSPNYDSRDGQEIDMLVLHYTGMPSAQDALNRLCDPEAKVSAHYVVDEDGSTYQLVDESMRAWHAGVSYWRGHTNINQRSIGIEIVNPGHEFGYRPFPEAQMQSVIKLCKEILSRHAIPPRNVVGHSDIAPTRKEDPGELFDWKRLAQAHIGLWPSEKPKKSNIFGLLLCFLPLSELIPSNANEHSVAVKSLPSYATIQKNLQKLGYECNQTGHDDSQTRQTIMAFQRHFLPTRLTGIWDRECELRLQSLLDAINQTR